jgi:hypothetical protein
MKITIITHDVWGFGKYIHLELEKLNHESTYINCTEFRYEYTNILNRVSNFCSKVFLNKNIKKSYRTNKIIETLENLAFQDYILFINSGDFNPKVFDIAKAKTSKLITYNYDSVKRVPLTPNANEIFDKIYSFDSEDVKNNPNLIKLNNYIYIEKQPVKDSFITKAFIAQSKDKNRNIIISKIADQFDKNGYEDKYDFIIVDKRNRNLNKNLKFVAKNIPYDQILSKIENTEIMIDIVRKNQTGLSFRVFESLAYQKKLIITNPSIKKYSFYNPNNILVIDEDNPQIPKSFLEAEYKPIDDSIYKQFTLNNWVKTVFELDK